MLATSNIVPYIVILGLVVVFAIPVALDWLDLLPHSRKCERSDCERAHCERRRAARQVEFKKAQKADLIADIGLGHNHRSNPHTK